MEQKTPVLVIGRNAAGKSTLVRSVSGAGRTIWHGTEDKATEQAIYTWSQSLQEAHVEEDVLLDCLQHVAGDKGAVGVVFASGPTGDDHLALEPSRPVGRGIGLPGCRGAPRSTVVRPRGHPGRNARRTRRA
jgi:energy-coupling factor transporter ATP-binding protein EcfA2